MYTYIKIKIERELHGAAPWRKVFPSLSRLARKYLSVQASSAECERMFSISGHIFSLKRRRMSINLFISLVLLKLNQNLL